MTDDQRQRIAAPDKESNAGIRKIGHGSGLASQDGDCCRCPGRGKGAVQGSHARDFSVISKRQAHQYCAGIRHTRGIECGHDGSITEELRDAR
jgi:hypothetical protein